MTPLTPDDVAPAADDAIAALERRVTELEQRVQEAGRRAIFHADSISGSDISGFDVQRMLADVGRALLFDPETPETSAAKA